MNLRAINNKKSLIINLKCRMKDNINDDWEYGYYIKPSDIKSFPYYCEKVFKYNNNILKTSKLQAYKICENYEFEDKDIN